MTVTDLGRAALRRDDPRDVFAALRVLPPALGRVDQPGDRVVLRVRALAMTPEAEMILHHYVRVFSLATLRLRSDEDFLEVRNGDLTEALGLPPTVAARVSQLVLLEDWMYGGGSGSADGEWSRTIDERTRAVMTVGTVEDYIALEGQRFWTGPAAMLSTGFSGVSATGGTELRRPPAAEPSAPGVTVEELHPRVSTVSARLLEGRHFDQAVHAGALALRDVLREASGLSLDGTDLAGAALGGDTPPIVVADLTTAAGRGEQAGMRMLAQGCFQALRNPVAHVTGVHEDRISAMEALAAMSLVVRRVAAASAR